MENLKVGLQLYSIVNALTEDFACTLAKVKAMGYDYVEISGGRYDHTGLENKKIIEQQGLTCISAHQSQTFFLNDQADAVNYVKELGVKYCVIPLPTGRLDAFQKNWGETIDLFTRMGKAYREIGVQLLYHNHDFEITKLPGDTEYVLDKLLNALPEGLLQPEFDTCWISYGGLPPADYINKYADRLGIIHIKDYMLCNMEQKPMWQHVQDGGWKAKPATKKDAGFRYTPVGTGVEDWKLIVDAAKASKVEYLVVEQDASPDRDPLEAAAMSRSFLKNTFGI